MAFIMQELYAILSVLAVRVGVTVKALCISKSVTEKINEPPATTQTAEKNVATVLHPCSGKN